MNFAAATKQQGTGIGNQGIRTMEHGAVTLKK